MSGLRENAARKATQEPRAMPGLRETRENQEPREKLALREIRENQEPRAIKVM
jgi:hypothetical protein